MTGDIRKDTIIGNGVAIAIGVILLLGGFYIGVSLPDNRKPPVQEPHEDGAAMKVPPPGYKDAKDIGNGWVSFEWEGRKWAFNGTTMVDTTSSEAYTLPEPEVRRIYEHMHKGGWVSIEHYPDGLYIRLRQRRIGSENPGSVGAPPPPVAQ